MPRDMQGNMRRGTSDQCNHRWRRSRRRRMTIRMAILMLVIMPIVGATHAWGEASQGRYVLRQVGVRSLRDYAGNPYPSCGKAATAFLERQTKLEILYRSDGVVINGDSWPKDRDLTQRGVTV